jgi:AmmeMemoRadiSam system protein A
MPGSVALHPLVAFTRAIIECAVHAGDPNRIPDPSEHVTAPHSGHGGVFVTLTRFAHLRGCIGTLDPDRTFVNALRHAAVGAALHDSRFPPLTPAELLDVAVHISVLTPARPWNGLEDLMLGRHGIVVQAADRRGVFLPQVATNHGLDKETFLSRCCAEKAGLPHDAWRNGAASVLLFETVEYR